MLQVRYRELREQGLGTVVKHTPVVTPDEDVLWRSKVIGDHDPSSVTKSSFLTLAKASAFEEERSSVP